MDIKRREFLGMVASAASLVVAKAQARVRQGVDYELVALPGAVPGAGEPVRVIEYFNYSCPACNSWYPAVERFLRDKPEFVEWERVPLEFARSGGLYAQAHYVMEAFGKDDLAGEMFRAIHSEGRLLNSKGRIAAWLANEHGLDEEKVESAFDSFGVDTKRKRGKRRAEQHAVSSTPSFVVADRYLVSPAQAGSPSRLFEVIEELATLVHEGKAPQ